MKSITALVAGLVVSLTVNAQPVVLVTGLEGGSGSAVGPDGALYVTEGAVGRITRVDPRTGEVSTFASGLPPSIVPIGGAIDLAFIGQTAYALVTLVGVDVGGSDTVGIYRIDGPDRFTVIADIGEFSINNPPNTSFFVPSGVQYAMEPDRGGFLVTDGHHNRVLRVTLDGEVSEAITLDNLVPTGLAVSGDTVLLALAGAVPHLPEDGQVVSVLQRTGVVTNVAAGARLLVDVELGRGRTGYALAQGIWDGVAEGSPALPDTGELVAIEGDGTFSVIADAIDRPTSLEVIGNTGYVVTLDGEIWRFDDLSAPPFGESR